MKKVACLLLLILIIFNFGVIAFGGQANYLNLDDGTKVYIENSTNNEPSLIHVFKVIFIPGLINILVDGLLIIIILYMLKRLKEISFRKILLYVITIFITGLCCNIIGLYITGLLTDPFYKKLNSIDMEIIFALCSGVIIFINNFLLAKVFLKVDVKLRAIIGLCFAIFTNPIIMLWALFH